MSENEFLKFNNKSINYADLKNKLAYLKNKLVDLNNAEKTQGKFNQVLSIFDQDGNGKLEESNKNGENELKNLWDALKKAATKNIIGLKDELDQTEIDKFSEEYLKNFSFETKNIVNSFVNFVFGIDKFQPSKVELTEKEAKNEIINTIMDDVNSAATLYYSQDNGKVSDLYDKLKEKDILGDKTLSATKVEEALALEEEGAKNLIEARDGKLSKKEYYLKNKEHLKTLLIRRLYEKDEKTGLDFLDSNRGSMSKKEFGKFLEDYINSRINEIQNLDSIKSIQAKLVSINNEETNNYLNSLLESARKKKQPTFKGIEENYSIQNSNNIPSEFNSDEPISFEEVFKYERGCEYSKENVEYFLEKKQKMQVSVGAYNKYKVFENEVDKILKDYQNSLNINAGSNIAATGNEISFQEQEKKIISLYEAYYENPVDENLAKEKLKEIIKKANLPIQVKESEDGKFSLDLSAYQTNSEKNSALNGLLKYALQDQERILKGMLGGDVEEKMLAISQDYKLAHSSAFGDDFSEEIVKAMAEDNKTFIPKYTGEASTKGMMLIATGAALSLTPAAPLGGLMLGLGNTLALGGMVSESGLGLYEANTRDKKDEEEISDLTKTAIMNAGGFIVGFGASKMGMKAFNKLVDKKLAAIFKEQMSSENRLAALKEVFTNPEMLKNFATAAGAKLSTDFLISYAGDLVMMGILDPKEDWESLLKSNLMGVLVGTASDVADVGKLAGKKKTGVRNNEARVESEQNTRTGSKQTIEIKDNEIFLSKKERNNIKTSWGNGKKEILKKYPNLTLEEKQLIEKIFKKPIPIVKSTDFPSLYSSYSLKDTVLNILANFNNGVYSKEVSLKMLNIINNMETSNDRNFYNMLSKLRDFDLFYDPSLLNRFLGNIENLSPEQLTSLFNTQYFFKLSCPDMIFSQDDCNLLVELSADFKNLSKECLGKTSEIVRLSNDLNKIDTMSSEEFDDFYRILTEKITQEDKDILAKNGIKINEIEQKSRLKRTSSKDFMIKISPKDENNVLKFLNNNSKNNIEDLFNNFEIDSFRTIMGDTNFSEYKKQVFKILESSINNPKYSTLNNYEKTLLKLSILMYDLNKYIGNPMTTSSLYAKGILDQIKMSQDIKDQTINIINHSFNHDDLGFNAYFRTTSSKKVAEILVESDAILKDETPVINQKGVNVQEAKLKTDNILIKSDNKNYIERTYVLKNGKQAKVLVADARNATINSKASDYGYANDSSIGNTTVILHNCKSAQDLKNIAEGYNNPNTELCISTMILKLSKLTQNKYGGNNKITLVLKAAKGNITKEIPQGYTGLKKNIRDFVAYAPKKETSIDVNLYNERTNEFLVLNPNIQQIILYDINPEEISFDIAEIASDYKIPIIIYSSKM